ncbi:NUDIX domain-containing protein [Exiguobacterium sp. BRG2]|uniref:NUDIX hydrolase n=1 Tax=Exiguobacterium sp. BRG2 TaxID=2962584 RepID=UPI002880C765|nr:NUDIX domain-containing protein [Exiguobacterium sp. BRG2]MDT0172269.1 NUDIX domain-containing protein [Exiguobacterium sp. BRG2]
MDVITFGQKVQNQHYITRSAVYAVLRDSQTGKIAVIQKRDGKLFLPGGGIEDYETHEDCLKREIVEETGMDVEIVDFIGRANQHFYSQNETAYYLNEGQFYRCDAGQKVQDPIEDDHVLQWIDPADAIKHLFHEHQRWAVQNVLKKKYESV